MQKIEITKGNTEITRTIPTLFLSKTKKHVYKKLKGPTHTCCLIGLFENLPFS